ncbi:hypothetical protein GGQ87_000027 [Brevundimonas alba]|uniref:Uncharacterized protein n=1 Tax=Brevundimonas alba TaxID=74314 RepID=A0A7X6BMA1_9CAUL|nr:hypothetical protein [Brevundimonas alba]
MRSNDDRSVVYRPSTMLRMVPLPIAARQEETGMTLCLQSAFV